jgi:hypothetical protein
MNKSITVCKLLLILTQTNTVKFTLKTKPAEPAQSDNIKLFFQFEESRQNNLVLGSS